MKSIQYFIDNRSEVSDAERERAYVYISNILKYQNFINVFDAETMEIEKVILMAFLRCRNFNFN